MLNREDITLIVIISIKLSNSHLLMWILGRKKVSLKESGIFEGFTDWHSHILPGVDDGIKTMEDAIDVLEEYERLGFKRVWLTPHIMEDYPNKTEDLKRRFEELKDNWKGEVELFLASENMLDMLFEERLLKKDFLPIGDGGDHLLIETSYYTPPYAMDEMLESALKKGFNLVLAHPERYRYMEEKDYRKFKEQGVKFQLNLLSLVGAYGESAKKRAEWLLAKKMVDLFGTDIHRLEAINENIRTPLPKPIQPEAVKSVVNQLIN